MKKHVCVFRKTWLRHVLFHLNQLKRIFTEEQANKSALRKTKRDVSLLKKFMRMKEKDEEFENVEPREFDEILCAFILAVGEKRTEKN